MDSHQLAAGPCQFVAHHVEFIVKSRYLVLAMPHPFDNRVIVARAAFLETGGKVNQGQPVIGSERFVEKSSLYLVARLLGNNRVIWTYAAQHIKKTNPRVGILQLRVLLQSKQLNPCKAGMLGNEPQEL